MILLTVGCISPIILLISGPINLKRMHNAITKESLNYGSRLPGTCSWRLEDQLDSCTLFLYCKITYCRIVIDIGSSASCVHYNSIYDSNADVFVTEVPFERQDFDDLPSYSDSNTRFCSRCSVPRRDLTANFCSSCGQSFDEY
ncbi:hypothetical protein I4U23_012169 [Adineta vaga]|nr:hypothetical protein I4U23_012169 [Adineta vaga]